jgi:hypothetical protein
VRTARSPAGIPVNATFRALVQRNLSLNYGIGMTVALTGGGQNERNDYPFRQINRANPFANGANLYAYVTDEPVFHTDLSGLFPCGTDDPPLADPPLGRTPDGTDVDPAGWRQCLFMLQCLFGLNKDAQFQPKSLPDPPPIIRILPPTPASGRKNNNGRKVRCLRLMLMSSMQPARKHMICLSKKNIDRHGIYSSRCLMVQNRR